MKVYILVYYKRNTEGLLYEGIFSSEEKALQFLKRIDKTYFTTRDYKILEVDLIK